MIISPLAVSTVLLVIMRPQGNVPKKNCTKGIAERNNKLKIQKTLLSENAFRSV